VELQPEGSSPVDLGDGFTMIPVPGHTRGHAVYLYRERYLFTGDHMAWDPSRDRLYAFRGACWYSWSELVKSMQKLVGLSFEWVLPGHGRPIHLPQERMAEEMSRLAARLKS
jgi:glyoxylase-like metal-dependent hydrolase (beta-lactamase superfamily II)